MPATSSRVIEGLEGSTGIYFFNGAANNTVVGNNIGTNVNGKSGRGLGMGDYGVLLYNASNNPIAKSLGTTGSWAAALPTSVNSPARYSTATGASIPTSQRHPEAATSRRRGVPKGRARGGAPDPQRSAS